jgi:hypothetical protein
VIRTVIIHATISYEGDEDPDFILTQRLKKDDEQSMEDFAEQELHKMCEQLHAPKLKWVLA